MSMMRPLTMTLIALVLFVGTGCGSATSDPSSPPATTGPPQPTLDGHNLPGMTHSDRVLSAATLGREAVGLAPQLASWGYVAGSEREFRGSGSLQDVISRTLLFGSAAGARSFLDFVHVHPNTWLGTLQSSRAARLSGGRAGYVL